MTTLSLISFLSLAGLTHGVMGYNSAPHDESIFTIETTGIVPASLEKVWQAWTTSEGICTWMVPSGKVDFRINGSYRTSYNPGSDLTGPEVIENKILAYDPLRMITINNAKTPADFPFKEAMAKTWTVIYFKSIEANRTEVTVRMNGFDESSDSKNLKKFFTVGNKQTIDALVKLFEKSK
ncbi:MAG TPA: SRPBCC domain-containing protein [Fimbriimonas sp.]|nr:SRPBCC domain-containing protein [Fimbriimonas sp.]